MSFLLAVRRPLYIKPHGITLIDDASNPGPSWNLINAWPVGYTVPDLNGMGGEVAIQSLELCHEGLEHTPAGAGSNDPSTI